MNCQTGSGDICVKSVYADNSSFRSESGSIMLNSCHGNSQVDVGSGNLNVGKSHRQAVLIIRRYFQNWYHTDEKFKRSEL